MERPSGKHRLGRYIRQSHLQRRHSGHARGNVSSENPTFGLGLWTRCACTHETKVEYLTPLLFREAPGRPFTLESRCGPAIDTWTDDRRYYSGSGGGVQYIIPSSFRSLELVT